jgi:hypothetical protein
MTSDVLGGDLSRDRWARFAGGAFLAFILASVFASMVGKIGLSDADSLYQAITNDTTLFRLGLVSALLSGFLFLLAAWGLYVLLRPVNTHLALLFLVLNAVGVAVQCASMLPLISVMLQGDEASRLSGYSAEQLTGMAHLSIGVYGAVFVAAQLFYSAWLFPLGYLVYKSGFLPKFLGVLLILDGFANLFWFFRALLLPDYPALNYPGWVISFLAEAGLALWLLLKATDSRPRGARPT